MFQKILIALLIVVVFVQGYFLLDASKTTYPTISVDNGVYTVEVVDDQLEDDSVRAVKYQFNIVSDEFGQWKIDSQSSTFACWEGRGHAYFSDELCL